ncbi:MAG: dihydrolipoyl dehydrogenase [Acidobacteria bacterium]|nr:MAG: dihydrolipoyl dehydrogenase [Acidobacteriota bacterium]
MATSNEHDLVVIGAGPGGYVAAIRAAQLGLDVACVEKEASLGGTCLRVGCIPSKALLEASERYAEAGDLARFGVKVGDLELDLAAMMAHKDKVVAANTKGVELLFKKNGVHRYRGLARFDGPGTVVVKGGDDAVLHARHVLIATGSAPASLPGVEVDGERITTSDQAIAYPEVPGHLVVIGAGVIGLELGSVWARLGARVTVLEYMPEILPGIDVETARIAQRAFKKQGLAFHLGARVTAARATADGAVIEAEGLEPIACDRVLVAVGRKPYTADLGLDAAGLELDERGRIPVGGGYRTRVEGIYAIGDVIAGPMLAHKAEEEGIACVEGIVTGYGHVTYEAIPNVVYTEPEIAAVGKSEEELKEAGVAYRKGVFPYAANGRARALGKTTGQVKLLADEKTDRLLGAHAVGTRAGDLIAELAVAIEFGASAEDVARSPHAHPTLAEIVKEAALAAGGRAIHI